MSAAITVTVSEDVKDAMDAVVRAEGISPDQLVERAVKEHLFVRRFRLLRERMVGKAQRQGILTDQDVFERVS